MKQLNVVLIVLALIFFSTALVNDIEKKPPCFDKKDMGLSWLLKKVLIFAYGFKKNVYSTCFYISLTQMLQNCLLYHGPRDRYCTISHQSYLTLFRADSKGFIIRRNATLSVLYRPRNWPKRWLVLAIIKNSGFYLMKPRFSEFLEVGCSIRKFNVTLNRIICITVPT